VGADDVEVVRQLYAAVNDRDMAAAAACFTPDARWTLPGRSPIAGTHVGWDQIYGPPACWPTDFCEPGSGEDSVVADVELAPGDLLPWLRDHRVALHGAGATFPCELDSGRGEGPADPAAPEARAGDKAGHRPDTIVGGILVAASPNDPAAQQVHVDGARLDGAPAGGFVIEVGDQAARGAGLGMAGVGLFPQPLRAVLHRHRAPLTRGGPEPLALAARCIAARAEDRLQVLPGRRVRRHDGDRGLGHPSRVRHPCIPVHLGPAESCARKPSAPETGLPGRECCSADRRHATGVSQHESFPAGRPPAPLTPQVEGGHRCPEALSALSCWTRRSASGSSSRCNTQPPRWTDGSWT
jgi:hypothetical protein